MSLRRRALLAGVALLGVVYVVNGIWLARVEETSIGWPVYATLAYAAGRYGGPRTGPLALAGLLAAMVANYALNAGMVTDFIFPPLFGVGFAAVGVLVRRRAGLSAELHEATLAAEDLRELEDRAAEADERRRIARELHDVVAHSVSVMVIQAAGARRILERDPDRAAEAAALIERTGRDALVEMRRTLGIVGDAPAVSAREPQPTLAGLEGLAARFDAAGLDVVLRRHGAAGRTSQGADLAAYRIVQEALTNVLRHAAGARVVVDVTKGSDGTIALEVASDPGRGGTGLTTGGHGLVGMRERAALYGGSLEAGPRPGGGFRVAATLHSQPQEALA